jgi:FAD/FMN-containing dehydrogenase
MNKQKVARELLHIAGMLRTAFDSDRAYKDMKRLVDETYDTFKDYRKEAEGSINDRKVKLLDKMEWDLADVIDDLEKFKRMDD